MKIGIKISNSKDYPYPHISFDTFSVVYYNDWVFYELATIDFHSLYLTNEKRIARILSESRKNIDKHIVWYSKNTYNSWIDRSNI